MNYKPSEDVLISWIYGELDEKEKALVEKYFLENPDEFKRVQQLAGVTDILGVVKDKEVIAPPIIMEDEPKVVSFWRSTSFRTIAAIAASVLIVVFAARLMGTEVSYSKNEFRLSFGGASNVQPSGLTTEQVQEMIDAASIKNQQALEARFSASKTELDEAVKKSIAASSVKVNQLVSQASAATNEQIKVFVAGLQKEQLQQMRSYVQLSAADQQKYTDNLVVEFSRWLQEQRNQDITMFQTRLNSLEQNTDDLKVETEQILASIISNSEVKQNKY